MVRSSILGFLSKNTAKTFIYCPMAKALLWEKLEERFGDSKVPQITIFKGELIMWNNLGTSLMQDPHPVENQAYSMMQIVESQRFIQKGLVKHVNMVETPIDAEKSLDNKQQKWMANFIKLEMAKPMKGKQVADDSNFVNPHQ